LKLGRLSVSTTVIGRSSNGPRAAGLAAREDGAGRSLRGWYPRLRDAEVGRRAAARGAGSDTANPSRKWHVSKEPHLRQSLKRAQRASLGRGHAEVNESSLPGA